MCIRTGGLRGGGSTDPLSIVSQSHQLMVGMAGIPTSAENSIPIPTSRQPAAGGIFRISTSAKIHSHHSHQCRQRRFHSHQCIPASAKRSEETMVRGSAEPEEEGVGGKRQKSGGKRRKKGEKAKRRREKEEKKEQRGKRNAKHTNFDG